MEATGRPLGTERSPSSRSAPREERRPFALESGAERPERPPAESGQPRDRAEIREPSELAAPTSSAADADPVAPSPTDPQPPLEAHAEAGGERSAAIAGVAHAAPGSPGSPGAIPSTVLTLDGAADDAAEATGLDRAVLQRALARLGGAGQRAAAPSARAQQPSLDAAPVTPGSEASAPAAAHSDAAPASERGVKLEAPTLSIEELAPSTPSEPRPSEAAALRPERGDAQGATRVADAPPPTPAHKPTPAALARTADVLQQVRIAIAPRSGEVTLRLAPRELGRISIHLALDEGRTRATLSAERPETLEMLARHVPELRAAFEQRGVEAADIRFAQLAPERDAWGAGRDASREPGDGRHARRTSGHGTPDELELAPAALARALNDETVDLYA